MTARAERALPATVVTGRVNDGSGVRNRLMPPSPSQTQLHDESDDMDDPEGLFSDDHISPPGRYPTGKQPKQKVVGRMAKATVPATATLGEKADRSDDAATKNGGPATPVTAATTATKGWLSDQGYILLKKPVVDEEQRSSPNSQPKAKAAKVGQRKGCQIPNQSK